MDVTARDRTADDELAHPRRVAIVDQLLGAPIRFEGEIVAMLVVRISASADRSSRPWDTRWTSLSEPGLCPGLSRHSR